MRKGVKKHGRFDARTDTRDHYREMQEECFDIINYNVMQIQKLEVLRKRWRSLQLAPPSIRGLASPSTRGKS